MIDAVTSPTPSVDVDDVFNDIDNMFQGLAQELDEMLTLQEWRVTPYRFVVPSTDSDLVLSIHK